MLVFMSFDLDRSVLVIKSIPFTQVIISVIIYVHVVIGYLNARVITLPNND